MERWEFLGLTMWAADDGRAYEMRDRWRHWFADGSSVAMTQIQRADYRVPRPVQWIEGV